MSHMLVAVCGLSPQVITEALYGLWQQNCPVQRVAVLTTKTGRDACLAGLFGTGDGAFHQFCHDYQLKIAFSPQDLHVATGPEGRMLEDIVTPADNQAFLRLCVEQVFAWTSDHELSLSFLLAGGRKTMSACLATAAGCYGRPQDRLWHVLVSPGFESLADFYYPPPKPQWLESRTPSGQRCYLNTQDAQVQMVAMPLISLRPQLTSEQLQAPAQPEDLLARVIPEAAGGLCLHWPQRTLYWHDQTVALPPSMLALYTFFVQCKQQQSCPAGSCHAQCRDCFLSSQQILEHAPCISHLYQKLRPGLAGERQRGIQQLDLENFQTYRSRLNRTLRQAFGPYVAESLGIAASGSRPGACYGIPLPKDQMRIVWPDNNQDGAY